MKFIFILEDEPKFQKEIAESISAIDESIQTRFFYSLAELFEWYKVLMKDGKASIANAGGRHKYTRQELTFENQDHELSLIIFKEGMVNSSHLKLLAKLQKSILDHQACKPENPTSMILTAFDNPDFKIKEYLDPILSNIIFKPFDKLLLQQHLIFAINGRKPPEENALANQSTTAAVEMLKDIQIEALSDVGFVSLSDRPIELGSVSKYYGEMFTSLKHRSAMAICHSCHPHPKKPELYQAVFTFYALDQLQITNLRKLARAKEAKPYEFKWAPFAKTGMPELHIACLDEEENQQPTYMDKVEKMFSGVKVHKYKSFGALMADIDPAHSLAEVSSQKGPSFNGFEAITFIFDQSGCTYLSCETDTKKDVQSIFGTSINELKNKYDWLAASLSKEHKEKYKKYLHSGLVLDDGIIQLGIGESAFPLKVSQVVKETGRVKVILKELSAAETLIFRKASSKITKPLHIVITSPHWCTEGTHEKWNQLREALQSRFQHIPKVVLASKEEFSDKMERYYSSFIDEIFYKPIDPVYLMQKIKVFYPAISEKLERVKFSTIESTATIKSVNQVKVTEISEASFIMEYYRPLSVGSFREIVLWKPNELEAPEILATCNFVEESESSDKDKSKKLYKCHFVFFGSTDAYLKHIRLWILENYVQSKEAQAS